MTSNLPATMPLEETLLKEFSMSRTQFELIRDTYCKKCTADEIKLFMMVCKRTGLDPTQKQIYPVKRWDKNLGREVMTIQTGIDGYRLIADRTDSYAPGREPTFTHDKDGKLMAATSYVKKMTKDGTWHEVAATAKYKEYVQCTKDGIPTSFWRTMPENQLAKCAEALALRKAFPGRYDQVLTKEEMEQAYIEEAVYQDISPKKQDQDIPQITMKVDANLCQEKVDTDLCQDRINAEQLKEFIELSEKIDQTTQQNILSWLVEKQGINQLNLAEMPTHVFEICKRGMLRNIKMHEQKAVNNV